MNKNTMYLVLLIFVTSLLTSLLLNLEPKQEPEYSRYQVQCEDGVLDYFAPERLNLTYEQQLCK